MPPRRAAINDALEFVTAADGLRLALRRVGKRGGDPVVLTHGTFSNHRSCMGLAAFLAKEGFDRWVLDWRGHGASEHPNRPHSFDDIALLDVPAVIDAVTSRSGRPDLYWVGHSGGGLIAGMWMARFPKLASRHIKGLVMLASQATGAARSLRHRARIMGIEWWLRGRNIVPAGSLGVGPEAESAPLMRQWCRWNLTSSFRGTDGFDYMQGLSRLTLPVLGLAGAGDRFIAPSHGCQALISAYGSIDTQFQLCGKKQGFREDYTHNRLVLSRSASLEIWPMVAQWLLAKAYIRSAAS